MGATVTVEPRGPVAVACPHNREKRYLLEVHATLAELGWVHVCRCCENAFMDRSAKHVELCRRCRGPAIHGWRIT